ncbi:MAG: phenylacetate--CoA ligase family protein [Candidatus Thorarchaeota archaeon]
MTDFKTLYQQHEETIRKTSLLQNAYRSALYKENWDKHKINVDKLDGFSGLQSLPYSSADHLRQIWESHPIEDIILTEIVAWWYTTSGSMGNKKWIPWTYNDYIRTREDIGKVLMNFIKPNDRMMSIMLPPPFISGSTSFRILEGTASLGFPVEQLAMTPEYVADTIGLLRKRPPTILLCTPALTLRMAEEIAKNTPILLKKMAEEQKSAKLKIASVITNIKKIKPKMIFKELRYGFFGGEALDPYRKAIEEQFDIEAFDLYAFTEGYGAGYECHEHNGLHFPSFNGVIEIIPEKELQKEESDPNYIPEAVLLSEADEGLVGEIVLTDFKEALPLVRYRIRDLAKVISTSGCSCDSKAPRLKILGRSDNVINLGFIRFSSIMFDNLLRKEFKNGSVNLWEVYVSREGFKPKLSITIEPKNVKDEAALKKELFDSLHSLDIFQRGYDNQLFLFDDFKFTDKLELEVYGQGKRRTIRYDPNFFKSIKF